MARNSHVIPDLYFPAAAEGCSDQDLQTSDSEEEGGQDLEVKPGQKEYVDLSNEGFIPIHKLTLEDLSEPIRTEENFQLIMDLSKRVVKINNNRLSDKRRGDKGMMFKNSSLSGSGYLLSGGHCVVQILTNKHVLYNDEEMAKATFDVFFHYEIKDPDDKEKLSKRSRRGDGKVIEKTTSKYDLSLAAFDVTDAMFSRINEHCHGLCQMPRLWHHNRRQDSTKNLSSGPRATVCLISHPLGQAKQVSFGQALDYDPHTGVLHHNAPSRQGSSGAPVLVFTSQNAPDLGHCIIYHVGTDLKADSKIAQLEMFDHFTMEKEETYWEYTQKKQSLLYDPLSDVEFAARADASLQVAILMACAPIMGAFLMQNTINASHLEQRRNNPVQALVEYFDRMALFTDDPESLMLSLASTEALLYNSCMFARFISKHLQPLYIANPVSVYGRPGKWPGNVTPPEVQRTAWRLIQDAIMDSGFPPAVLAALDEDAERRSKLIDVYVDMKQLKWEKKILPHMFEKALADKERFSGVDIPRQGAPFPSATNYFVITVWYLMGCGKIVFQ